MKQPIFHPQTHTKLHNFLNKPTQGLLLTGKEGSGKLYTAQWLAENLKTETIILEPPEGKSVITIEQIRELYAVTRTGTRLTIIIKDSHQLSAEAQNAFLKLLEEPPRNVYFILTVHEPQKLLPTIRSRSQLIEVLPPKKSDLLSGNISKLTDSQLQSLHHSTEGLPGALFTLIKPDQYELHQTAVTEAKKFYLSTPYQRHLACTANNYDKNWSKELLRLLALIVESLLKQTHADTSARTKLISQSELLETTTVNLFTINGNPKIHLAKLAQQL